MKEDRSGNQSTLGDVGIRQVHDDLAGFVGLEEIFPQESMRTWNRNKGGEDQCANLERAWVRVPVDDNHYELQWTHRGRKHMEDPAKKSGVLIDANMTIQSMMEMLRRKHGRI